MSQKLLIISCLYTWRMRSTLWATAELISLFSCFVSTVCGYRARTNPLCFSSLSSVVILVLARVLFRNSFPSMNVVDNYDDVGRPFRPIMTFLGIFSLCFLPDKTASIRFLQFIIQTTWWKCFNFFHTNCFISIRLFLKKHRLL